MLNTPNWLLSHNCLLGRRSSQVGIAIGYQLQGYRGACAAWLGFTLPYYAPHGMFRGTGLQYFNQLSAMTLHSIQLIVLLWWSGLLGNVDKFAKLSGNMCLMLHLAPCFFTLCHGSFSQVIVIFVAALVGIYFASDSDIKVLQDSSSKVKVQAKHA